MSTLSRLISALKSLIPTRSHLRFRRHNEQVFGEKRPSDPVGPVVLMELNAAQSPHIAYGYLAHTLSKRYNARVVAYSVLATTGWRLKLFKRLRLLLSSEEFGVYKSFGVSEFIEPEASLAQKDEARRLFDAVLPELNSKSDLEELRIENIWIGDLIYDTYLRTKHLPTIDITSPDFRSHLLESLCLFVFWRDYFAQNDVRGVNVSHCVYNNAIPLRVAVAAGVSAFQANLTHVYRLSERHYFAYNDFTSFPTSFASLPQGVKSAGLKLAKKQIERRFAGEVGVDMSYSSKSAFGSTQQERLLEESPRKKILVATHCFYDSPHSYGNNLFPDFYEWLDFLGGISEETDYDWYIKTHPDYLPGTMDVLNRFFERYPKFRLLPASSSHHQIISEGIDYALTVYGTIGFEYAALGVPVINASTCNPHVAYNFNLHPSDMREYREIILNLNSIEFSINVNDVYEYYFMKNLYNTNDIFFDNFRLVVDRLGGYNEQFSCSIYNEWVDSFSKDKHEGICEVLSRFVDSGDFRLGHSHLDKVSTLEKMEPNS